MKQICPIMVLSSCTGPAYCIYERCAWWSYDDCACAMAAIACFLNDISCTMDKQNDE